MRRYDAASRRRRTRAFGRRALALMLLAVSSAVVVRLHGQDRVGSSRTTMAAGYAPTDSSAVRFTSVADSVEWEAARALAARAWGFRIVISLFDRRLWAILNRDTLLSAPVAVASGATLEYQGRRWSFRMPRGRRTILRKDSHPVWVPPEWHYYEVAQERGLVVKPLVADRPVPLADGTLMVIRSGTVGLLGPDSAFVALPPNDEIIVGGTLYIPPIGTRNRLIEGELGAYRIDLGDGYLLHGTPHDESIGRATTHGCVRLRDADVRWIFELVPKGYPVYIY